MAQNQNQASPTDVAKALKGADLPMKKQELVEYAKSHDGGPNAVSVLERMPDREYQTMADVEKGVGQVL